MHLHAHAQVMNMYYSSKQDVGRIDYTVGMGNNMWVLTLPMYLDTPLKLLLMILVIKGFLP